MELQPHAELVLDFGRGPMRVHLKAGIALGGAGAPANPEIARVTGLADDVAGDLTADEIERIGKSLLNGGN